MDVSNLVGKSYSFENAYNTMTVSACITFLDDGKVKAQSTVSNCGSSGKMFTYDCQGSWEASPGKGASIKFVSVKKGSNDQEGSPKDAKQTLFFEFAAGGDLLLRFNTDPVDADEPDTMTLAFGHTRCLYHDKNAKERAENKERETQLAAEQVVRERLEEEGKQWSAMANLTDVQKKEMQKATRVRAKMQAQGIDLDSTKAIQSFLSYHAENKTKPEVLKTCVATIAIYLRNVTEKPWEPKYQHINCKNENFQKRVSSLQGALEIFKACGFVQIGEALVLDPEFLRKDKMVLLDARTKLEALRV